MVVNHIIDNFKPEKGYHCITTSYKQVMHYFGIDISEEMLFGLGSGLSFFYGDFKVFPYPMIGGRVNIGKFEESLVFNTEIGIEVHETTSIKRARTELYNLICRNIPVPIYVDMGLLEYLKFPEGTHFGGHTIVVFGIDENEGLAYISDRDSIDYRISGLEDFVPADYHLVPLKELEEARNSKHKPYPPKNKWVTFDLSSFQGITKTMIIKALEKNCEQMLNAPIKSLGLKGIKTFSKKVLEWNKFFDEKLKGAAFNSYIMIDQMGGTGGGAFRKMYGTFLKESAEIAELTELKELGQSYIDISYQWDKVGSIFLKVSEDNNRSLLKDIQISLERIHENETTFWKEIYLLLNKLL